MINYIFILYIYTYIIYYFIYIYIYIYTIINGVFHPRWGSLLGPGKPFDPTIFFIFCGNVLGSPYGSASPITINPDTGHRYGPSFPLTTLRDDVRIHKYILDQLKVKSVEYVIGGSLGGMQVCFFFFEYIYIYVYYLFYQFYLVLKYI